MLHSTVDIFESLEHISLSKKEVFKIYPKTVSQVNNSNKEPTLTPSLLSRSWRTDLSRNFLDIVREDAKSGNSTDLSTRPKVCLPWTLH